MPDNSANNKRIAKNTVILYFRMLLLMVVSLYTGRVMLRSLGEVDYGLTSVIGGVIAMFSYLNNTLSTATSRFLTFELGRKDISRLAATFNNSFLLHGSFAFLLLILGETGGLWVVNNVLSIPSERMYACNILYQVTIASTMMNICRVPFNALIIAYERMGIYAYLGIYDAIVKLVIALSIAYTGYDRLIFLAILLLVNDIIVFIFYWAYCRHSFQGACYLSNKHDKQIIRSMLGFTTWSLWGSTAMMARNHGITILINVFFGATVNAANAIAYKINTTITNFTSNFTVALNPQITKTYAAGEHESMKQLVYRGGRFSFYLLLLLCYPVFFETDFLLSLWLGEYPKFTVELTRLVLILSMTEIFNSTVGCAVQATGKIKWYQIVISTIQLFTFPVAYVLFKLGLPPYSALATMVTLSFIAVLVRLYYIKTLLNIPPLEYFMNVLLRCGYIALLALIVPSLIVTFIDASFIRLVISIVSCCLWTSIIVLTLGVDATERAFIMKSVAKLIHR